MIDLLLIHPGAVHGIYGALGDTLVAVEPPLWARLIAAYVRNRGYTVAIIDQEAERLSPGDVARRIDTLGPRLVAICAYGHQPSASTQTLPAVRSVGNAIRELLTNRPTVAVLGGHVSALPERTIREEPVDLVVKGEGPVTVVGILEALAGRTRIQDVPGCIWLRDDEIVINDPAPMVPMEDLHGDAWDLLPMDLYRAHQWQCFDDLSKRAPYAAVMTSLNCPYRCSFCCISAPFGNNQYRMRNPAAVADEIYHLWTRYGVRTFKITDEMFCLNRRHVEAISAALCAHCASDPTFDPNIWAYARIDSVMPDLLALMRRAGFRWLALGIESSSEHVRDGSNKHLRNDDIVGVVRRIQASGINVIGNFIVGLPDDTSETMEDTYQLAATLNCEFINIYSGMLYPGSPLYTQAIRDGRDVSSDWRTYSQHNEFCLPMGSVTVSPVKVLAFRDSFFDRYFSRPEYLDMIRSKFNEAAVAHVEEMLKYHLPRNLFTTTDV